MQKAVVVNGCVTNIIVIESGAVESYCAMLGCELVDLYPAGPQIGDTYDGCDFYRDGRKLPLTLAEDALDEASMTQKCD